jgi:hypothetical protein
MPMVMQKDEAHKLAHSKIPTDRPVPLIVSRMNMESCPKT